MNYYILEECQETMINPYMVEQNDRRLMMMKNIRLRLRFTNLRVFQRKQNECVHILLNKEQSYQHK
jgi:hypothetical protein